MASTLDAKLTLSILNTSQEQGEANVLYLENDSNAGDTLELTLKNSGPAITLYTASANSGGNANAQNYSFYLYFQPSTVLTGMKVSIWDDSQGKYIPADGTGGWKSASSKNSDGSVDIYFLKMAAGNLTNQPLKVLLEQVVAAPGPSRASNVELHLRDTNKNEVFCQTYLNVINHQGQSSIPIQVTAEIDHSSGQLFYSGGQVFNDGKYGQILELKMFNTGDTNLDFSKAKIQVTFTRADQPYALISQSDPIPNNVTIFGQVVNAPTEGVNLIYTLENKKSTPLSPGKALSIQIPSFKTSLPPGIAYLSINYYDIPGYWDGSFKVPLMRTSLIELINENFGVGTNIPAVKLDVRQGGIGTDSFLGFSDVQKHTSPFGVNIASPVANNLALYTAKQEAMRIDPKGNVGIGISNPLVKLDVRQGGIYTDSFLGFSGTRVKKCAAGVYIAAPAAGNLAFYTDPGEAMRIDSKGNVGIGISNPLVKLDVRQGGIYTDSFLGFAGVFVKKKTMAGVYIAAPAAGNLAFYTDPGEAMRIDSKGNVGIGTNAPQAKLEVAGSVSMFKPFLKLDSNVSGGTVTGDPINKTKFRPLTDGFIVATVATAYKNSFTSNGWAIVEMVDGTRFCAFGANMGTFIQGWEAVTVGMPGTLCLPLAKGTSISYWGYCATQSNKNKVYSAITFYWFPMGLGGDSSYNKQDTGQAGDTSYGLHS